MGRAALNSGPQARAALHDWNNNIALWDGPERLISYFGMEGLFVTPPSSQLVLCFHT